MPMAAGRRVASAVPLGLLLAVQALSALPGDPAAVRWAGIGVLWWIALVAAPVLATLAVVLVPPTPGARGVLVAAAWASPALLVTVAARVFAGTPGGPVTALAVLAVPLAALAAGAPRAPRPPGGVAALAALGAAGLALWASFATLADAAALAGARRWQAAAVAAALALLATDWRPRSGRASVAPVAALVLAGAAGLVLPLVSVEGALGAAPWTAWRLAAARPALTFGERSSWVTEGGRFPAATVLDFTEAHRVTALAPGAYKVVEQMGGVSVTREWRLASGDALTLRPGDRLALEAGARVRFEAGKRVPGAPASGTVWADPPERGALRPLARRLAEALTLLGGALVLARGPAPARTAGRRAAPLLVPALVLVAAAWGIYATLAAPDLGLGASGSAGPIGLPAAALRGPAGQSLVNLAVLGLLALGVAGARALGRCAWGAAALAGERQASLVWSTIILAAALASVWPADGWTRFLDACGLAASAVGAPRAVGGGRHGEALGAIVGAATFLALRAGAAWLPSWALPAAAYPALLAAPLAGLAARALR